MSRTLLALLVPDVESLVGDLRSRLDPAAKLGLGAHFTVLYPFYDSEDITKAHLETLDVVAAMRRPLLFSLDHVGTFPSTVWLAPAPDAAIVELAHALEHAFPGRPATGRTFERFVPHLSVARNLRRAAEREMVVRDLERRVRGGTTLCRCTELHVMGRNSGGWKPIHCSPLGPD
ncbi:2'-5' RNA ligase family protein [Luteibacter sp.]|uniref:2'-5' RNA ligase family protein n=1 Tax=Luteibacter sp. TaxID=1886636 RepID=UPI003F7FD345